MQKYAEARSALSSAILLKTIWSVLYRACQELCSPDPYICGSDKVDSVAVGGKLRARGRLHLSEAESRWVIKS